MRSRFLGNIACGAAVIALSGCVQATRHSNTMLFGTNTTFGIKAGTATGNVPEVVVGYDRQEAVIMPLVANVGSESNSKLLEPCDLTEQISVQGNSRFAIHPCSLVAVNKEAMDSYSVLASFGAQFDANGSGAKGGLAQYFATGVAAQLLAISGGAAVVATGDAAKSATVNAPNAEKTVAALYGNDTAFQVGVGQANNYTKFIARLGAKIELTSDAKLKENMTEFEKAVSSQFNVAGACTSKADCLDAARQSFAVAYGYNSDGYNSALDKWKAE